MRFTKLGFLYTLHTNKERMFGCSTKRIKTPNSLRKYLFPSNIEVASSEGEVSIVNDVSDGSAVREQRRATQLTLYHCDDVPIK